MPSRSSIFSSDTLTGWPRPSRSLVLAFVLCGALRIGMLAAGDRLDHIPAPSVHAQLIAREDRLIREAQVKPKVALMGDSIMLYGVDEDRLAELAGLPRGEVVNLGIESGRAWDALVLMRRNPDFFSDVRLVIFNVTLSQVTITSAAKRFAHFRRFSTLEERWRADFTTDRASLVVDWAWPCFSERRDLATWLVHAAGDEPAIQESLRPAWVPANMQKLLARRQAAASDEPLEDAVKFDRIAVSRLHRDLLGQFVECWRDRGVPVLLVYIPVAPSGLPRAARAADHPDFISVQQFLQSFVGEDVAVANWLFDTSLGFNDGADYLDEGHMTPSGAAKMSCILAEQLDRLGWLRGVGRTAIARTSDVIR